MASKANSAFSITASFLSSDKNTERVYSERYNKLTLRVKSSHPQQKYIYVRWWAAPRSIGDYVQSISKVVNWSVTRRVSTYICMSESTVSHRTSLLSTGRIRLHVMLVNVRTRTIRTPLHLDQPGVKTSNVRIAYGINYQLTLRRIYQGYCLPNCYCLIVCRIETGHSLTTPHMEPRRPKKRFWWKCKCVCIPDEQSRLITK